MKGLFIPEITTEMFRNGCLEAIKALMVEGEIYDIDYDFKEREPCEDTISRQAALDAVFNNAESPNKAYKAIRILPPAQPEQRWIPFVLRPATDEEKEENPGLNYYLDGKLPDDGQKILITVRLPGHEEVQVDEFYTDADGSYLDSQYEIGTEAVAWMPMPEPYRKEGEE